MKEEAINRDQYYIYATRCLINNRIYVGMRKSGAPSRDPYLGSGSALKKDIAALGRDVFVKEILCTCSDVTEAKMVEELLVTPAFIKRGDVYNMVPGGKGSFHFINANGIPKFAGRRHTREAKEKMALRSRGRTHSPETRAKMVKNHPSRKDPERWSELSKRQAGRRCPKEVKDKLRAAMKGRKLSLEEAAKKREILAMARTKRKIAYGPMPQEQRAKIADSVRASWPDRRQRDGAGNGNRTRLS